MIEDMDSENLGSVQRGGARGGRGKRADTKIAPPTNIKLFEEVMIVASVIWVACIFLGHEGHIRLLTGTTAIDLESNLLSIAVYVILAIVTAGVGSIIYMISRRGSNGARWMFGAICLAGLIAGSLFLKPLVVFYKTDIIPATGQTMAFGLMLIGVFLITVMDTEDWFQLSVRCRQCQRRLLGTSDHAVDHF